MNDKWNISEERADRLCMPPCGTGFMMIRIFALRICSSLGRWLNATVKEALLTGAPHITLLLQNQNMVLEALWNLLSQLALMGLINANKNNQLISKRMG